MGCRGGTSKSCFKGEDPYTMETCNSQVLVQRYTEYTILALGIKHAVYIQNIEAMLRAAL